MLTDHAALDEAARPHAALLSPMLVERDGRVKSELRSMNWHRSRRALMRPPVFSDSGEWQAIDSEGESGVGRGVLTLVAWLGRVEPARAAGFLSELLKRLEVLS